MAKSWLVDGLTLARNIKASGVLSVHNQVKNGGANWDCPHCGWRIEESSDWPGLPSGVKFDPTDVELLGHLAAKCGVGDEKLQEYMDVFIPTIEVEHGICYQHPENLPGSRKDGNSFHLFYRTTNAYAKGQRKRRKICNRSNLQTDVRWHKTGKTKAIFKNGVQIGCKKIMVLYGTDVMGSKPSKMNWVMHQYHLGTNEDEKDGEYVVAKIFYRAQKRTDHDHTNVIGVDEAILDPRTPMISASDPLRAGKTPLYEDATSDYVVQSPAQEFECFEQKGDLNLPASGDDFRTADLGTFRHTSSDQDNAGAHNSVSGSSLHMDHGSGAATVNLDMGSPPYFNLADLYFPSEDSFCGWLDLDGL